MKLRVNFPVNEENCKKLLGFVDLSNQTTAGERIVRMEWALRADGAGWDVDLIRED